MSFWSAYGVSGSSGVSSRVGSTAVLPYTEEDPANTSLRTPASRAATSRFSVASTLARWQNTGSATDRGTDGMAAWCST